MGLCKTSNFSIFTFINAYNLKFCTRYYNRGVYRMRFKGSNGKVCEMTSHFRTLFLRACTCYCYLLKMLLKKKMR